MTRWLRTAISRFVSSMPYTSGVQMGGGDEDWPNDPGLTLRVDHPFDTTSGWELVGGAESIAIISDAGSPISPPSVLEYSYIDASQGNFAGRNFLLGTRTNVYFGLYFKIQDPWDYHDSTVNKMLFFNTNQSGTGNEVVYSLIGSSEANAQMRFIAQDPESAAGYRLCNVNPGFWSLDDWHLLEGHMTMNTGGLANGTVDWWVDDVHCGSYTNVKYNSTGNGAITALWLQPYFGGTPHDKSQIDKIFYAHLRVTAD